MAHPHSDPLAALCEIVSHDAARRRALDALAAHGPPDSWIAAGFVRNAVWDALHDRPHAPIGGDVDVIWLDRDRATKADDLAFEHVLRAAEPGFDWSVKNQARMHVGNGDAPYPTIAEAMRHWPETATAVAVRRGLDGGIEVLAPFGLDDLFALVVRPTPHCAARKPGLVEERARAKGWAERWPRLVFAPQRSGGIE